MSTWRLWLRHWQARAGASKGDKKKTRCVRQTQRPPPQKATRTGIARETGDFTALRLALCKQGPSDRPMKKGRSPFGAPAFPTSHARYKPVRAGDHLCGQPVGAHVVRQVLSEIAYRYAVRHLSKLSRTRPAPPRKGRPAALGASPFRGKARSDSGGSS